MELPAEIQKIWDILTPEQQAEVMAELTAAAPATDAAPDAAAAPVCETAAKNPEMSDAEIFAFHNLPGTPVAIQCACVPCKRVEAAAVPATETVTA